ncbi:MAG: lytic transglycosylase, partial [Myxococcota bacterium]
MAAVIATLAFTPTAPAGARDALPRPPELESAVRFWIRIYGEIDGRSGLIHDSEHLDVVYEVFDLSPGLSGRAQERRIEAVKRSYRDSLRRLAQGARSGLSKQEERALSRWPKGTTNQTLRDASRNLRFQLGQADKFRAGVVRSGRWAIFIERVLREHDVPTELSALPQVESSYDPRAYSRVG